MAMEKWITFQWNQSQMVTLMVMRMQKTWQSKSDFHFNDFPE
jgi:hypothetical protein